MTFAKLELNLSLMMIEYRNISTSRWWLSFLVLAIVCFGLVYPADHLHHSHDDGLLENGISSQSTTVDADYSADHHHEGDVPHTNDHQHTYDKHIDWHIIRTQGPRILAFDDQGATSSTPSNPTNDDNVSSFEYDYLPYNNDNYALSLVIRGPPLYV